MQTPADFSKDLRHLNEQGFLLVEGALSADTVAQWQDVLYGMYERGEYEIDNSVGNVAFEKLLALQPDLADELIGHESVAAYLKAVLGRQCQLRSLRAHVNPRAYKQEWHLDFYDYHYQREKAEGDQPLVGLCMNTTFYLTDNPPERGRLTFLKNYFKQPIPDGMIQHMGYTDDRSNPFQTWCDNQDTSIYIPRQATSSFFTATCRIRVLRWVKIPRDVHVLTSFYTTSRIPCFPVLALSAIRSLRSIRSDMLVPFPLPTEIS